MTLLLFAQVAGLSPGSEQWEPGASDDLGTVIRTEDWMVGRLPKVARYVNVSAATPACLSGAEDANIADVAIADDRYRGCQTLRALRLPEALTVGNRSLSGATSLTLASMPKAEAVGQRAFENCPNLAEIDVTAARTIGAYAFVGTNLSGVALPSTREIHEGAFSECHAIVNAMMPFALTIGDNAFENGYSLEQVNMKSAVVIGARAFRGCRSLQRATMDSVRVIKAEAFAFCERLVTADLPMAEQIDTWAFAGATKLYDVTLPAVNIVGNHSFKGCSDLRMLNLPRARYLSHGACQDCSALNQAVLPAVTRLEDEAFRNCVKLVYLDAPQLREIGSSAFHGCVALEELSLAGVRTVGAGAFQGCDSLKRLEVPRKLWTHSLRYEEPFTHMDCNSSEVNPADPGDMQIVSQHVGRGDPVLVVTCKKLSTVMNTGLTPEYRKDSTDSDEGFWWAGKKGVTVHSQAARTNAERTRADEEQDEHIHRQGEGPFALTA